MIKKKEIRALVFKKPDWYAVADLGRDPWVPWHPLSIYNIRHNISISFICCSGKVDLKYPNGRDLSYKFNH